MKKLALAVLAGAALFVLAACNPADSISDAYAEPRSISIVALHPEPAADAQDGAVYEYH